MFVSRSLVLFFLLNCFRSEYLRKHSVCPSFGISRPEINFRRWQLLWNWIIRLGLCDNLGCWNCELIVREGTAENRSERDELSEDQPLSSRSRMLRFEQNTAAFTEISESGAHTRSGGCRAGTPPPPSQIEIETFDVIYSSAEIGHCNRMRNFESCSFEKRNKRRKSQINLKKYIRPCDLN